MVESTLIDTDVFIQILKKDSAATVRLHEIGIEGVCVSAVTAMELFVGALNKRELGVIKKALTPFDVVHINQGICARAVELVETYSKSHGLMIPMP